MNKLSIFYSFHPFTFGRSKQYHISLLCYYLRRNKKQRRSTSPTKNTHSVVFKNQKQLTLSFLSVFQEMSLSFPLSSFIPPIKDTNFNFPNSFSLYNYKPTKNIFNFSNPSFLQASTSINFSISRIYKMSCLYQLS
jgi:hypothetical protein